jgi:hypothetical protein
MIHFLKKFLFLQIFLYGNLGLALPIGLQVLQASNKPLIIFEEDAHPGACTDPNAENQAREDIIEAAQQLDAFVICEDMACYDGDNKGLKKNIKQVFADARADGDTCMNFTISDCKKAGIRCWNAEFRHAKFPSMNGKKFARNKTLLQSLGNVLAFVKQCEGQKQSKEAAQFCQKVHEDLIENNFNLLVGMRLLEDDTLADILKAKDKKDESEQTSPASADESESDEEDLEQDLTLFDVPLFNANLVAKINQIESTEKVIIVRVGNGHSKQLIPLFETMGYKRRADLSQSNKPKIDVAINENGALVIKIDSACGIDIKKIFAPIVKEFGVPLTVATASSSASASALVQQSGTTSSASSSSSAKAVADADQSSSLAKSLIDSYNTKIKDEKEVLELDVRARAILSKAIPTLLTSDILPLDALIKANTELDKEEQEMRESQSRPHKKRKTHGEALNPNPNTLSASASSAVSEQPRVAQTSLANKLLLLNTAAGLFEICERAHAEKAEKIAAQQKKSVKRKRA